MGGGGVIAGQGILQGQRRWAAKRRGTLWMMLQKQLLMVRKCISVTKIRNSQKKSVAHEVIQVLTCKRGSALHWQGFPKFPVMLCLTLSFDYPRYFDSKITLKLAQLFA